MKGILMAGGSGTRLNPITEGISKQLIQIYDKPMVYYSLSTLMLAKIQDINIVCQSFHIDHYQKLLGDGSDFGINLTYSIQIHRSGIRIYSYLICNYNENNESLNLNFK